MTAGEVARLAALDSCAVSDALDFLGLPGAALGLRALSARRRIAGRAVTVDLTEAGEGPATRHLCTAAVDAAGPGDVIVVAHHGHTHAAGWGGVLSAGAVARRIEGVVVDGAVRDLDDAQDYGLPVYAVAAVPVTARGRVAEREWNVAVRICGVAVDPGDFVIADASGVVFVPRNRVAEVLSAAERIAAREAAMVTRARGGAPMVDVMSGDYETMLGTGACSG